MSPRRTVPLCSVDCRQELDASCLCRLSETVGPAIVIIDAQRGVGRAFHIQKDQQPMWQRVENLSPERTDDGLRVSRAIGAPQGLGARDVPGLASDGKHPDVVLMEERSLLVRLILLRRRVPGVLEVAAPELDRMTGLLRGDIDPGLGDNRVLICSNDHDVILCADPSRSQTWHPWHAS